MIVASSWIIFWYLQSFQAFQGIPGTGNATLEFGQLILTSPLKFNSEFTPAKWMVGRGFFLSFWDSAYVLGLGNVEKQHGT